MRKLAVAVAVIVVALGLVACGGGGSSSTSSSESAEVAKGVALYHEWQHLQDMLSKGVHRMSMAMEYGTPQEVESLEETEDEIRAQAHKAIAETEDLSRAVQREVTKQIEAEE